MHIEALQEALETIKSAKKKKHNVAQTSVDAYNETSGARVTVGQKIIEFISDCPGSSREEIAEATHIKLQSITGNVPSLIRTGRIEERETKLNREGHKVKQLWPVSK